MSATVGEQLEAAGGEIAAARFAIRAAIGVVPATEGQAAEHASQALGYLRLAHERLRALEQTVRSHGHDKLEV